MPTVKQLQFNNLHCFPWHWHLFIVCLQANGFHRILIAQKMYSDIEIIDQFLILQWCCNHSFQIQNHSLTIYTHLHWVCFFMCLSKKKKNLKSLNLGVHARYCAISTESYVSSTALKFFLTHCRAVSGTTKSPLLLCIINILIAKTESRTLHLVVIFVLYWSLRGHCISKLK